MAAIGYEKGIIYLIKLADNSTVTRLRGHDGDIQSIIFLESYLVTASKDKTIRLWSRETFKCAKTLKLPKASGYKGKRQQDDSARVWTTLTSTNQPNCFISSGQGGDIINWQINHGDEVDVKLNIFCENQTDLTHQRVVFGLARCGSSLLISTSMDRVIKVWCLDTNRPLFSLVTNGGFVYTATVSPIDSSSVSYGVGDGMFRVWQRDTDPGPEQQTVWQGVKEKVTALAWNKGGDKLAFGTELGKVGTWTLKSNKVNNSTQFHKKTVYALCWFGDDLLSCGGDSIVYIHSFSSDENQQKLSIENKSNFSTLATFDKFVCGGDDNGDVFLFSSESGISSLSLIDSNTDSHSKYVTCIALSPNYIVTCSNSGSVVIAQGRSLAPYRRLGGHTERVNAVCFSPDETQLVTASMDGTCQIWSIESGDAVANYDGHTDSHVYCVVWTDSIISGADDYVLRTWNASDCQTKIPPEKKSFKSQKRKPKQKPVKPKIKTPEVKDEKPEPVRSKKAFGEMNRADLEQPLDDILLLYRGVSENGDKESIPDHLVHLLKPEDSSSHLKQIVKTEIKSLIENGSIAAAIELSTWLHSTLTLVTDVKLNDMMVALSASAGPSVWRQVVRVYIGQLVKEANYSKAAAYQVTLGDAEKAVSLLCEGRQFRDALILAKLQNLSGEDILAKWAERATLGGNVAQAAKCCIANGDVGDAINMLKKRNDLPHLFCSLNLAIMAKMDTTQLLEQFFTPVVSFGRWSETIEFLKDKKGELSIQARLFVYYHWKLSTGYGKSQSMAPSFSTNDQFSMSEPATIDKRPFSELFLSEIKFDKGIVILVFSKA